MQLDNTFNTISQNNTNGSIAQKIPSKFAQQKKHFPFNLPDELGIVLDQSGKAVSIVRDMGNPYVLHVGSRALNNAIRKMAYESGISLSRHALLEINESLQAHAEMHNTITPTWSRVSPIKDGIEIDVGDEEHTRVRISNGRVETISNGSEVLFYRPALLKPMVFPSESGNWRLLKKYVNLDDMSFLLFMAWLSYTLAHPKISSSKYVILAILGGQGSGKSLLSKIIKDLIDPSVVGVQVLPGNTKDLAIAGQQSHVLCYDNLRQLSPSMADALCVAATGGSMSGRKLYSDGDQHVLQLHVALVLNGIHAFIDQPDLAQRCLPLHLQPLADNCRRSEAEMAEALAADMPAIQRGLLDLIAQVFMHLPKANVSMPERMFDFCRWLAAMEMVDDAPDGAYQGAYSYALGQGQRDALLDNVLAAALLDFGEGLDDGQWFGTPTKLLEALCWEVPLSTQRSRDWPDNPIALSKRLQSLQAGLLTQGVRIDFSRGKERTITINKEAGK